jgi:hypothetical protein
MRKTNYSLTLSIQCMGLVAMLCFWTSCSSPKLAQTALPLNNHTSAAYTDEAPQAAQARPEATDLQWTAEEVELVASNDPTMLPAVTKQLDASLADLSAENPKLARKMSKLVHKAEQQAAVNTDNASQKATAKDLTAVKKLLSKAEKKFDIKKAKEANAAQANTTLVGLGALLAVVGLVLLLVTSGTAATIGLISLIVGVVLLVISLLS